MPVLRASQPPASDVQAQVAAAPDGASGSASASAGAAAGSAGGAPSAATGGAARATDEWPDSKTSSSAPARASAWRSAWQLPTIIVSGVLILLGLRAAIKPPPPDDFEGALAQVEELIGAGEFETAAQRLREGIEPTLMDASPAEQGWFHALSADLTFASQQAAKVSEESNHQHIDKEYAAARELGFALEPPRIARWGETRLALDDLDGALDLLSELKPLDVASTAALSDEDPSHGDMAPEPPSSREKVSAGAAEHAYGRLFRQIIEYSLARPEFSYATLLEKLAEYRAQANLDSDQQLWLAARMAELRLESEEPSAAIAGLLVDMRRLEGTTAEREPGFGELYGLLGRAHHLLGDDGRSSAYLKRALDMLAPSHPARGDVLVLLAALDESRGDLESAFEKVHTVVREYVGTRSFLPALLARAQIYGILGDHHASQSDYRELAGSLTASKPRRDVAPASVAASLIDRYDAAIALGKIERALDYISIAERLFDRESVPAGVLLRLASAHRQLADNLLSASAGAATGQHANADPLALIHRDPALRHEANEHYILAGEYSLRHAAAAGADPLADDDGSASLWAAADSFDHGGRQDRAIALFQQYLDNHPADDGRVPETLFRLAQAHQARVEYDVAAQHYRRVIAEIPRSAFAARSYVPLAQCEAELGHEDEAAVVLEDVLAGLRLLSPDAGAYRDALIELGRLRHRRGEFTEAIERLTEAAERYPNDPLAFEVLYLLADSYRGSVRLLDARLAEAAALSPADRGVLVALRTEQLQSAEQLFGRICDEQTAPQAGAEHSAAPGSLLPEADGHAIYRDDLVRRAHLYRGDCAFELAKYGEAVELYERAARRYSSEQGSMYALVQIVNCYAALGDGERAAAAHHRALQRLKQLPDQAFATPDALLDRAAWERWLNNNPVGPPPSAKMIAAEES